MKKELEHANPIIFPKDKKGVQVKIGDKVKGFGFITAEDGKEVFAHFSEIQKSGFKKLTEGEEVTFEITKGAKGPQASNIKSV